MAKLFAIQHRSSICRTVLFTVFLDFAIVNKCTSNPEICLTSNTRSISYFKVDTKETTWFLASRKCNDKKSILPVICNKSEQNVLINYLKVTIGSSAAWTSGKKINFNNWTWIDGQPFIDRVMISTQDDSYTHIALERNGNYKALSPQHRNYYLCQYSGSLCNSGNGIYVANGCVKPSYDDQTWFDARNRCLKNGSDLAILKGADLVTLGNKLDQRFSYWIGLRKNTWNWIWQGIANSGEEIKYSNLSNDGLLSRDECISINASNGAWNAVGCTNKKKVVCQRISDATTLSTVIASVMPSITIGSAMPISTIASGAMSSTKITSAMSSTTTVTNASMSEGATESRINSNVENDRQVFLYSGLGAGIVIIAICIIAVILAVRRRKFPKEIDHSKDNINSEQHRFDEFASKPDNSPASASENTPLAGVYDTRGVYAEISLATLNQPEDGAKTEQSGIVYAALEFQTEPTSLERDKKRSN